MDRTEGTCLGVFPTGPITLSNMLPASLLGRTKDGLEGEQESDEDDDARDRRKTRRGKMGIRNGFAMDNDE